MAAIDEDHYLLPRNLNERERLNHQHGLLIRNAGYLIHPSIRKCLPPDARIADIATGTGAWAIEVAETLSESVHVTALDISSAQLPTSGPPNVTFGVADARKPFPEADHGKFDLVHVRALVLALQPDDWDVVVRNVVQLLKPGGSLQWVEADLSHLHCMRGFENSGFVQYSAMPKVLDMVRSAMGKQLADSIVKLPEAAFSHLEDVYIDFTAADRDPDMRAEWSRQVMVAMVAAAQKSGALPPDEVKRTEEGIAVDLKNGAYVGMEIFTVIGQKP